MKKINFLSTLTLLSIFLVSCGGPQESSKNSVANVEKESMNYEEIVLDFSNDVLNNVPVVPLVVETEPERFAYQPIVIKNEKREAVSVVVDSASLDALNGVEVENSCAALLERKKLCYISLFVNRNEQMGGSVVLASTDLIVNINGTPYNIPVQAQTSASVDLDALAETQIDISSVLLDFSTVIEGKSSSKVVILRNNSRSNSLPINKDISALTMANEVFSSCPVSGELERKSACFIYYELKNTLAVDNYSEVISIAGRDITLSAVVDPQPVYTSNNNVIYEKAVSNAYQFDSLENQFQINITNDSRYNDEILYYDFFPELTSTGLTGLDYPSAFSIDDNCENSVSRVTTCRIKMSFDPERFHFGVSYSKTISFNDEVMTLDFEGSSPCSDPADPLYQPGTKLSEDKSSCVPNLGVFDSPDSVYGHAVYQ